jgi:hypothetical protein
MLACKMSRVRFSSSPLTENAAGHAPVAFFDGVRELVILGLTRADPFADPLDSGNGSLLSVKSGTAQSVLAIDSYIWIIEGSRNRLGLENERGIPI